MKVTLVGGRKDGDTEDIADGTFAVEFSNMIDGVIDKVRYTPTDDPTVWAYQEHP